MSIDIKPAKDVMFKHVEGLPSIKKDGVFNFALDGENLLVQEIKIGFIKNEVLQTYKIPFGNVLAIGMILESEVIQKDKSVIGRGIAGALLFGGVGAIVGGMSAIGKTKEKEKHKFMFAISYLSDTEPDAPKDIIFDPNYLSKFLSNDIIAGRLKKAHKSYPKSPTAQKYLDGLNAEANAILKRDEDGSIRL